MKSPNPKTATTPRKETSSTAETPITKVLRVASGLKGNADDLVVRYRDVLKVNEIHGPSGILRLHKEDWMELGVPMGDKRAILSAAEAQAESVVPLPINVVRTAMNDSSSLSTITPGGLDVGKSLENLTAIVQRLAQRMDTQSIAATVSASADSSTANKNSLLIDEIRNKIAKAAAEQNDCECGKSFLNKRQLARHKKDHCKLLHSKAKESDEDNEKKPKAKTGTKRQRL